MKLSKLFMLLFVFITYSNQISFAQEYPYILTPTLTPTITPTPTMTPTPTSATAPVQTEDHGFTDSDSSTNTIQDELKSSIKINEIQNSQNIKIQLPNQNQGSVNTSQVSCPSSYLVGHWTFDETNGSALDSSGNGHNGTTYNIVPGKSGKFGNAFEFNGSDSYVSAVDHEDWNIGSGDYSISMWVKPYTLPTSYEAYLISQIPSAGYPYNVIALLDSYSRFLAYNGSAWVVSGSPTGPALTSSIDLESDGWYHIVLSISSTQSVLYIDKTVRNTKTRSGSFADIASPLFIGGQYNYSPGISVNGLIDDVRIYKGIAVDQDQVNALYDGCGTTGNTPTPTPLPGSTNTPTNTPTPGTAIAFWELNGNFNDSSGNGYNGTSYGAQPNQGAKIPEFGTSYLWDGINDYVSLANLLQRWNPGSISFWYKTNSSTNGGVMFSKITNSSETGWFIRLDYSQKLFFGFAVFGNYHYWYSNNTFGDTTNWHHIAIVYDDGDGLSLKAYHDGVLQTGNWNVGNGNIDMDSTHNNPVHMGHLFSGNNYYNGYLDHVRVYNSTLSPSEVTALYSEGLGSNPTYTFTTTPTHTFTPTSAATSTNTPVPTATPTDNILTIANFPDDNFREAVADIVGESISAGEAATHSGFWDFSYKRIDDLTGIEHFTGLMGLDVSHNNIQTMDLHENLKLSEVVANNNLLTEIDVSHPSNNSSLYFLDIRNNRLTDLSSMVGNGMGYGDTVLAAYNYLDLETTQSTDLMSQLGAGFVACPQYDDSITPYWAYDCEHSIHPQYMRIAYDPLDYVGSSYLYQVIPYDSASHAGKINLKVEYDTLFEGGSEYLVNELDVETIWEDVFVTSNGQLLSTSKQFSFADGLLNVMADSPLDSGGQSEASIYALLEGSPGTTEILTYHRGAKHIDDKQYFSKTNLSSSANWVETTGSGSGILDTDEYDDHVMEYGINGDLNQYSLKFKVNEAKVHVSGYGDYIGYAELDLLFSRNQNALSCAPQIAYLNEQTPVPTPITPFPTVAGASPTPTPIPTATPIPTDCPITPLCTYTLTPTVCAPNSLNIDCDPWLNKVDANADEDCLFNVNDLDDDNDGLLDYQDDTPGGPGTNKGSWGVGGGWSINPKENQNWCNGCATNTPTPTATLTFTPLPTFTFTPTPTYCSSPNKVDEITFIKHLAVSFNISDFDDALHYGFEQLRLDEDGPGPDVQCCFKLSRSGAMDTMSTPAFVTLDTVDEFFAILNLGYDCAIVDEVNWDTQSVIGVTSNVYRRIVIEKSTLSMNKFTHVLYHEYGHVKGLPDQYLIPGQLMYGFANTDPTSDLAYETSQYECSLLSK